MEYIDREINLQIKQQFTPIKDLFEKMIKAEELTDANIVCWVPHEVASLVQVGVEDGLTEDLEAFLADTVPQGKWLKHDEPGTPFRHNSYEHFRTKLMGNVSLTLIVKDGRLYMGQWQNLYFYSPVYQHKPEHRIFCRILKLK
jgi:secondary thiamine-phosphate synthase enzyme